MSALHQAIEYSALGWVKPELDETLRQVRVEVEGFAEDPSDTSRMRVCADLLHQVQGTLRMVELYAPAMVAEEMEHLSLALQNGQTADRDNACSALMRGVVLLPDYLERLQSGHKEISIVLLPMLNELRAARGESVLSESVLFNPDLDRALPSDLPRTAQASGAARSAETAPFLVRLRDALQSWPEQGAPTDPDGLKAASEALLARSDNEAQRRMFWVASMVADALRARALSASPALRQAYASVEREARAMFAQAGYDASRPEAALEPTRQLLYHVSSSDSSHPTLNELRRVFDLDALKPTESELDHARGSVAGRNRSLLDTVAAAVKEDLLRVKDELDLYLRTGKRDPAELQPQAERLQAVSDTLGMLGLGLARSLVQQQRDAMQDIVEGKRQADETALLEVAGALLYVDASLDDQVARLAAGDGADSEEDLANAEARKVLDVLIREAITNFTSARQAFEAFVETNWSHAELEPVPKLLSDVSGALNILELPVAAQYLDGVRMYAEVELLDRRRVPNSRQIDTFADALASVEYYLEALREQRSNRDDILDITRNSLESLGYWPLPAVPVRAPAEAPAAAPVAATPPQHVPDTVVAPAPVVEPTPVAEAPVVPPPAPTPTPQKPPTLLWASQFVPPPAPVEPSAPPPVAAEPVAEPAPAAPAPAVPASVEPVAAAPVEPVAPVVPPEPVVALAPPVAAPVPPTAAPVSAGFDTSSDDIDDEIREIFLEEFEEEIGNLAQLMPAWKSDPNNIERLQPVRRVFHTLKGSGRLVGARTLGEFSWKIENMLNKVRDGLRPATPPVVAMVDQACAALPQLHAALRGDGMVTVDLHAMEAVADRIANGEEIMPASAMLAAPAAAAPAAMAEVVDAVDDAPAAEPVAMEEPGIPVRVDPVLFEILQAEVGGHLATIDHWLSRARHAPTPADEPLVRAIHTMNGAFAMTEVPTITDVLTPAEGYVRRLLGSGANADAEAVGAIDELAARVRTTIAALSRPDGRVQRCDALAAHFATLRDALPESHPATLVDEPVVEEHAMPAPVETLPSGEALPSEGLELIDLDLSAYSSFEIEPDMVAATPDPEHAALDAGHLEVMELDADAEAELSRLLGEHFGQTPAQPAPVEHAPTTEALELASLDAGSLEVESLDAGSLPTDAHAPIDADHASHLLDLMTSFEAEHAHEQQAEAERLEAERIAAEHAEAERLEAERIAAEHAEAERIAAEQAEAERLEAERIAAEHAEAARLEAERIAAEQAEAERLEAERVAAEQAEAARLEAERVAAEQAEAERREMELLEFERLQAEAAAAAESMPAHDASEHVEALSFETDHVEVAHVEAAHAEVEHAEIEHAEIEHVEAAAAPVAVPTAAALAGMAVSDPDAALDMDDLDPDLVDIFVEEGRDLLDHSDQLLVRLRESPEERDVIAGLQRDLHTLKGGARMAGIMAIGELGHAMESLLEAAAEHRTQLGRDDMPLLERGFDRLHTMVTRVGDRRAVAMPEALVNAFDARAQGRSIELPDDVAPTAMDALQVEEISLDDMAFAETAFDGTRVATAEPVASEPHPLDAGAFADLESASLETAYAAAPAANDLPPLSLQPVETTLPGGLKPLSAPVELVAATDEDAALRGSQEQVRVRAELLDRLVNYAGEVAIYRSRLEQQLGAFRSATAEMEQTNTRLRDQLRRLEIETEAQIIARYQREGEAAETTFDPLELDRFSNLQQLSRALVETSSDLVSLQATLDDMTQQYETLLLQQSRVSSELQEGLMRTRMVPFDTVVPRLRRVLRQAATDTGKQVQLKLEGAQGELDRNVLERMTAPLEHMLRNSVAHGLEDPSQRATAGKSAEGAVTIAIRKEGSEVVLQISDDGRGLNRDAIRARGEARGLLRKDQSVSNAQLDALIFEPGFSTAEEVTRLAGRGVGMDVVASEVRQLGGSIDIHSELGKGTVFTLRLPQTLAVTQAAFVLIGETTFAVPIASVRGVGRIPREDLAKGVDTYRYGNEEYVLRDLGKLLGHAPAKAEGQLQMPLLLTRSGDLHVAVSVDQIIGNREIVVKPIGPQVASIPGIFGATIMGDGSVVVILDVAPLVRRQAALEAQQAEGLPIPAPIEERAVPLVMVVDDSITMRKVTSRVLERHNFEVVTAKDGLDALERMAERVPDLMLLDIEMPRMDGYELATAMKAEAHLAGVPIIMITSRTGDKHRQRAMDIGVNRYLGKPYQENELMKNVFALLEETHPMMVRNDG